MQTRFEVLAKGTKVGSFMSSFGDRLFLGNRGGCKSGHHEKGEQDLKVGCCCFKRCRIHHSFGFEISSLLSMIDEESHRVKHNTLPFGGFSLELFARTLDELFRSFCFFEL